MTAPGIVPGGGTPISFSIILTRDGAGLDIAASFTAGGGYVSTVTIEDTSPAPNGFSFNTVGFLMGSALNGNLASYSNLNVTYLPSSSITLGERLLGIDFNKSSSFGAPSQSLFRTVAGSTTQGENASSYTKTIGSHQVTISQPSAAAFEFRGGNGDSSRDIPGGDTSISFLVADFIATRDGAIDISITNLAAGDYVFRSYHLEPFNSTALGFAQGATTTTPNTIEARIGGVFQGSVQPTSLGPVGLNTTFITDAQIPTLNFAFTHDGVGPLVIQLTATESNGANSFLLLNGFELFASESP
jgi:hypothetical protein